MRVGIGRRCHLLCLIAVLAVAAAIVASGCMWGVVEDVNNHAGLSGATVKVTDSYGAVHTTTTDANGLYSFDQAMGPVPAAGPVTVEVSAPGYSSLMTPRLVQYNDNANASGADLSSFWEVQSFALLPLLTPSVTADLAVTDLYPDHQPVGTLWARITNHGPDTISGASIQLVCQSERTHKANCSKPNLGPVILPLTVSLNPGQTKAFNTSIGLDTATYWYDANCTVQVSFTDPDNTNNLYSEVIPPPTGDLELQDILLGMTNNQIALRVRGYGSPAGLFCWYMSYPALSVTDCTDPTPSGIQAFWTAKFMTGTGIVHAEVDPGNCIAETDETNNQMTMTCSAASHSCW
jgi:hypothetical protein